MTAQVVRSPGLLVDGEDLAVVLPPLLRLAEQARVDGVNPELIRVVDDWRAKARLSAASGTVAVPTEPGHAEGGVPQRSVSSSSMRVGLTTQQAAAVAGVSERAMTKRARSLERCGLAWRVGREWRYDEAAVAVGGRGRS